MANFLVFRIVSFCSRSIKASHILISGDGLVTLSGLSHLHSLVKHGQRHRAVYDFPQFSTSVQPWLSPELLRQVRCGHCIGLSMRLECLLSLTKGQLCPYIQTDERPTARLFLFFLVKIILLGIFKCISNIRCISISHKFFPLLITILYQKKANVCNFLKGIYTKGLQINCSIGFTWI